MPGALGPTEDVPVEEPATRRGLPPLVRVALLLAVLAGAFIAVPGSGRVPSVEQVRSFADAAGPLAPVAFVPLAALLSSVFVPGPLLAAAAGLMFGAGPGVAVALLSTVAASVGQMLAARHGAGARVHALATARARRVQDFLNRRGFFAVLYIRLLPGLPFAATNYAAGLTRLRVAHMAAGTAIGALPRTVAYAFLGGSIDDISSPRARVAFVILAVGGVVTVLVAARGFWSEWRAARAADGVRIPSINVTPFQAVRVFSHIELAVFATLVVFAIGDFDPTVTTVLGWVHGFGWIGLCVAVYAGCRRGLFPWPLLAATVFVTGPLGSSIGVEVLRRRGWGAAAA